MSLPKPPATQPTGSPVIELLPAGRRMHRVHDARFTADSFNPTAQPSALAGGRFDSLDGSYAYTYLGSEPAAAVAETLCRRLPVGGAPRLVPRGNLAGRVLSEVQVTRDLPVLALHSAHTSQVGASPDLVRGPSSDYLTTRAWARSLRNWLPDVAGFRYRCRHDDALFAVVLFDDGPAPAPVRARGALSVTSAGPIPLDDLVGERLVLSVLRRHNATLSVPVA